MMPYFHAGQDYCRIVCRHRSEFGLLLTTNKAASHIDNWSLAMAVPNILSRRTLLASLAIGLLPVRDSVAITGSRDIPKTVDGTQPRPHRLDEYPQLKSYISTLRSIPAGTFVIGDNASIDNDQRPEKTVAIDAFYMGAAPVTEALWSEYLLANGITPKVTRRRYTEYNRAPASYRNDFEKITGYSLGMFDLRSRFDPNTSTLPCVDVSWDDIMGRDGLGGFMRWVKEITGIAFTLPSEAQYEFAASPDKRKYPWGDEWNPTNVWAGDDSTQRNEPKEVNRTSNIFINEFGLSDLVGNVWQWTSSVYASYSTGKAFFNNNVKALRGGSYRSTRGDFLSPKFRNYWSKDKDFDDIGFRLVCNANVSAQDVPTSGATSPIGHANRYGHSGQIAVRELVISGIPNKYQLLNGNIPVPVVDGSATLKVVDNLAHFHLVSPEGRLEPKTVLVPQLDKSYVAVNVAVKTVTR
jgi:formylglycine-generating enzyme required for sulfatase activity